MFKTLQYKILKSKKTFILLLIIILLVVAVLYQLHDIFPDFWPSKEILTTSIRNLKRSQKQLQKQLNLAHRYKRDKRAFVKYGKGFWIESRDGDKETAVQAKIKGIARQVGLELATVGRVQSSKICEGVWSLEVSLSAKTSIAQIGDFINRLYKTNLRFHWHTLTMRPDSLRKPRQVVANGNLRCISITDPDLIKLLLGKKK